MLTTWSKPRQGNTTWTWTVRAVRQRWLRIQSRTLCTVRQRELHVDILRFAVLGFGRCGRCSSRRRRHGTRHDRLERRRRAVCHAITHRIATTTHTHAMLSTPSSTASRARTGYTAHPRHTQHSAQDASCVAHPSHARGTGDAVKQNDSVCHSHWYTVQDTAMSWSHTP